MAGVRWSGNLVRRGLASAFLALSILPFAVASAADNDVENLKPPGDCTPEDHRKLQDDVKAQCELTEKEQKEEFAPRGKLACYKEDACSLLDKKIERFDRCVKARELVMTQCFRGGNKGHKEQADNARKGLQNCRDILRDNECKNKRIGICKP